MPGKFVSLTAIALLLSLNGSASHKSVSHGNARAVSIYGNSYVTSGSPRQIRIDSAGIKGWNNPESVISTYFSVISPGELDIALYGRNDGQQESTLSITSCGKQFTVTVGNNTADTIRVGRVMVESPGYVRVDMQGISGGTDFGSYTDYVLSGPAAEGKINAVPGNDDGNHWPYWGRRGPSVHMGYKAPEEEKIRWFYNEVTVPEGNDVLHSYYMANGFNGGYMGMQVNSPDINERRILFSVWSAFSTDNPNDIPEEYRIVMLRRGEGVYIGEFGNEGSGGQSYMCYPWEAGRTYGFLTEVRPEGNARTVFTGYFCGHDGVWRLVASFMRPEPGKQHETHYTGMHSFLENFDPAMGYVEREVMFGNQWAVTTDGRWIELTEGTFTIDNTGHSGIRLDYDGGVKDGKFYLRNCGFFNGTVAYRTVFSRPATNKKPEIDFEALPVIPSVK